MQHHLVRTRWAAIGAAVAVTLGAGGILTATAAGTPSSLVPIAPVRVLDTRVAGFGGALGSGAPRDLDVTGTIPTIGADGETVTNALVVPDGATGIVANVTLVGPTSAGFVAVRPGTATGGPTTSNLNASAAGVVVPNSVTVELPTAGADAGIVELWFQGNAPTARADILVDIVGYYTAGAAGPAGPAGPVGPQGPQGLQGLQGPQGEAGPALPITDQQIGMLRWDLATEIRTYPVGENPFAITFDGTNVWVANYASNDFTKITPTGARITVGVTVGALGPYSMVYTGTEIKVGFDTLNIGTLDPNGTSPTTNAGLPSGPNTGIAFDGTNTWIAGSTRLVKRTPGGLNTSLIDPDCANPYSVVFDGGAVWQSCPTQGIVRRIDLETFVTLATVPVGTGPRGMAYTGRYLWVANFGSDTVSRIDTTTNAVTTFSVGDGPQAIAYDGSGVWVTNFNANTVTQIRADGSQETIPVGIGPAGIVFDGHSVWVANSVSDTVTRIPVT